MNKTGFLKLYLPLASVSVVTAEHDKGVREMQIKLYYHLNIFESYGPAR